MGVLTHQSKDTIGHSAPLHEQALLHTIGGHGPLQIQLIRIFRRRAIVRHHQSGQRTRAPPAGSEHGAESRAPVVKFMISSGHRVVAHRTQGEQLRGSSGGQRLDQRTGGEISRIHCEGIGMLPPRPLQGRSQAGKSPPLLSILLKPRLKTGVQIMGKQHGGLPAVCLSGRPRGDWQQTEQKHRRQKDLQNMAVAFHAAPPRLAGWMVPGFILPQILQIRKRRFRVLLQNLPVPTAPRQNDRTGRSRWSGPACRYTCAAVD